VASFAFGNKLNPGAELATTCHSLSQLVTLQRGSSVASAGLQRGSSVDACLLCLPDGARQWQATAEAISGYIAPVPGTDPQRVNDFISRGKFTRWMSKSKVMLITGNLSER